jgi:hypothetical protein
VKDLVPLSELYSGDFFPPLEPVSNMQKSEVSLWSYISGDTIVEAFVILKTDFMELISKSLLSELGSVNFFPTREASLVAQDQYLYLHGWAGTASDIRISEQITAEFLNRNLTFENFCKFGG